MLEWANPICWVLLPLVVMLPWLGRSPRMAFGHLGVIEARPGWRVRASWLPRLFASLGCALLVAALARPQHVDRERVVDRDGLDILIALDTSGSMEARVSGVTGQRNNRLEVAKEVIADFVAGRPDDRIGLVVFGEDAFTQVPLTLDHDAFGGLMAQIELGMAGKGATAIGDAIAIGAQRLEALDGPGRVMILLTDGRNNAGQISPSRAAEAARALGIRIYTIGIGSNGGGGGGFFGQTRRRRGDLDEKMLEAVAILTGGQYFHATSQRTLSAVYERIDELEQSTAEISEFVHREERYHAWLGAGLLCLLLQMLLGETLFRSLP